jgi:aldehyde:ferredoxin oxidoreductase
MSEPKFTEVTTWGYTRPELASGYANQTLHVDVGERRIEARPVDARMKELFIGGRGFDLWLLWQSVKPNTKWNDPENTLCIASGPLGGTPVYPGSGKSIVCALSPLTGIVVDSNVGGYFGPYLKFSGFDALAVSGRSRQDLVLLIDGVTQRVAIYTVDDLSIDAYLLSAQVTAHFGEDRPRQISVVTTGPGARHTRMGCLNFSWYDAGRSRVRYKQAGRGGLGTVFADKGLRAIVARWGSVGMDNNAPAEPEVLRQVARLHSREITELDPKQNKMARLGTTHIVTIMNDYDLLPVHNFRYGSHPEANNLGKNVYEHIFDKGFDGCWMGCTVACSHGVKDFVPLTGPYVGRKVFVDGPEYETIAGVGSNIGVFDPFAVLELNFYCDAYGLDTISVGTAIAFAMECFELGLIRTEHTGGIELHFGNRAAALTLLHQMARGEGFGTLVGQGVRRLKQAFAERFGADPSIMADIGMESKGLEFSEYVTKESLAQQGGYGLALKGPQHDEAWLIFLDMVHNFMPSFEQKAEALHWFPMFRTWFGLCGLCKLPWNDIVPEDNSKEAEPAKVMKHVRWYAEYFSAVTGRQSGPDDLIRMSEVVYTFQRLFSLRMGYGRREHDNIPYRAMGPVTTLEYESRSDRYDRELIEKCRESFEGKSTADKISLLRSHREAQYEKLKDAVYERRGWTRDGIPSLATVRRLGIDYPEVVELLAQHGVKD